MPTDLLAGKAQPGRDLLAGKPRQIDQPEFGSRFDPQGEDRGSFADAMAQGLTFGFSDEIGGLLEGLIESKRGGDFWTGYNRGVTEDRRYLADYRKRQPAMAVAGEVAGALPTALLPAGGLGRGVQGAGRLGQAMLQGSKSGALYGGLYGAGTAEDDPRSRVVGAGTGAAFGGALGGALPLVGAGLSAASKPIRDAITAYRNPKDFAARKVLERMNVPVEQAATRLQNAPGMALMDVGGRGTQKLARTVRNLPYSAGDRLMTSGNTRAMAQGGRIKKIVSDVIADPDGYQVAKDRVINARRYRAGPAYDEFYRTPIPFTRELEGVLNTPAGRRALAQAKTNSLNSRQPWAQWFLNVADDGRIIDARRVPDARALDQIKRQLDDMVETAKRPADGSPFAKAMHTPESRSIKAARDDLVEMLDNAAPAYKDARRIAGESIGWDEALEVGRKALTTDPRVLKTKLATMSADEIELGRIGLAENIREIVDRAGFTHNSLLKLFNSRDQIARLKPFFRSEEDWATFRKAMFQEAKKRRSFDILRGNSTTAEQLADISDAGRLGDTAQTAATVGRSGVTVAAVEALVRGLRRVTGMTPQVADEIAKLLATRSPEDVRKITQMLMQRADARGTAQEQLSRTRDAVTRLLAGQTAPQLPSPQTR